VKTVLVVAEKHNARAAEFCRRHRHFTTTEAMDDLAAEFEKVAREARAEVLREIDGRLDALNATADRILTALRAAGVQVKD